jgi:curved DNA-binding protein CbpA
LGGGSIVSYYRILQIEESAQPAEIKTAYRRLARLHHPDRNPGDPQASQRFKQVAEAYEHLSDPVRRAIYDAQILSSRSTARHRAEQLQELARRMMDWDLRRQMERHPRVNPRDRTTPGNWQVDPQNKPYWQPNPFFEGEARTGYQGYGSPEPPPNAGQGQAEFPHPDRLEGFVTVAFDLFELFLGPKR